MGRGTVLLGGRMGCRPLWPRDLLDRVCHIRCQTWPLGGKPLLGGGSRRPWQRSLVGCSPWGRKESDMTEVT